MKAGDKVLYVPHEIHALEVDPSTKLHSWHVGEYKMVPDENGKLQQVATELTGKKLKQFLHDIRKAPNPSKAKEKLALIKPRKPWAATIRSVNQDGSVNLDIAAPNGFVTLHYDNVAVDETKGCKHSCHCHPDTFRTGEVKPFAVAAIEDDTKE